MTEMQPPGVVQPAPTVPAPTQASPEVPLDGGLTPEQLAALMATFSGNIDVTIKLQSGTKYTLTVAIPKTDLEPYSMNVKEIKKDAEGKEITTELADFKVTAIDNAKIKVNVPTVKAGTTEVTGIFNVEVTPTP